MTHGDGSLIGKLLNTFLALAVTVVFLFPIYWLFAVSFKTPDEIFSYPPTWLPSSLSFDNFIQLFRGGDVRAIGNSIVIAGVSTILAMVMGTIAAYSIARFKTGGENLSTWIISQRLLPPVAIAFPIFLLYSALRISDTYFGLILIYTAFNLPYVIWMMRGYIKDVPLDLEDSALVDGLNHWQILAKVVIPMTTGGLFATAMFTFIFAWNEFLFALILTRSNVITFPVQVTQYFGAQSTFWAKISAMSVLGVLPAFLAVATLQRFIVRGISMGAVKG
ncbi:multiple sugar transport system permease protein [Rhodoligotrophos appendicifer]|uniref:carbohydrate ABC transporter permease n=1 Tax=Rhodoligotrophos appendicifer TaxID=987056 RepID=UPI001184AA17|nr:carbohydrate ABC transporter permease [Rhodoligotrophos appendicifer]